MDKAELTNLLDRLRQEPHETEWLEFKENKYEPQLLGEYLSALSNSACLHHKQKGYLVFGIENRTHDVKGTTFNPAKAKGKGNQGLQIWLSTGLRPNVGFDIYPLEYCGKTVVLFAVNPAIDKPVSFYGKACVRIGTSKTELSRHPEKEREIWSRRDKEDWSAQICQRATIEDLDPEAVKKARSEYKTKFPAKAEEVDEWDDVTFLNKVKLTIQGKITNTALLLLGRPESSTLISPSVAKITWVLKDEKNQEKDYEHFGPPFLMNVERVFAKVRNLTYRHMPNGTLFPIEITQYDRWVIREALHNCIAHQDYSLRGRINLVEMPEALILTNMGSFLPGSVEEVVQQDAPPEIYRNPFLADAMVNLNMIDTQGGGIKKMFLTQMRRYFPLPDYDLDQPDRVAVKIRGEILDPNYVLHLSKNLDLNLNEVMLLDKVQKGIKISKEATQLLRKNHLVEGRYPRLHISSQVAALSRQKAKYMHERGLAEQHYAELIIEHIRKFGSITRKEADELLFGTLPSILNEQQKKNKVHRILSVVLKGRIHNKGTRTKPKYVLREDNNQ